MAEPVRVVIKPEEEFSISPQKEAEQEADQAMETAKEDVENAQDQIEGKVKDIEKKGEEMILLPLWYTFVKQRKYQVTWHRQPVRPVKFSWRQVSTFSLY